MIRRARLDDLEIICELGYESLQVNDPYPEMRISKAKIREMATEMISGNSHFAWVDEQDGDVVGAVCAYSSESLFYERKQLNVVMFYTRRPGGGGWLLRELIRWWKGRPALKMICFVLESGTDPKLGRFLERHGLRRQLPCYVGVK